MRKSKVDDDIDAAALPEASRSSRQRNRVVAGGCAIFSLILCTWIIADAELEAADSTVLRRPLSERAVDKLDEIAETFVHQPRHVPPPCAVNITGFYCPNGHGTEFNGVYMLESHSIHKSASASQPSYRSADGVWLVHSAQSCLSRNAWILSRSKPDESTGALQGACDIEAHIFGTQLLCRHAFCAS